MVVNPIERIYIACYKGDFHLTKICVASIRYWYPDIPITLVKDYTIGFFDTSLIEKHWNVNTMEFVNQKFGWSFIKLEPFFLKPEHKMFLIDSDIVFLGPILDKLNEFDADFTIHGESNDLDGISQYYNPELVRKFLDPAFEYPGYVFNCGQIVGTAGILSKKDFEHLIDYSGLTPELKFPEIFSHADQGIMNYTIHSKELKKEIQVGSYRMSIWSESKEMETIDLEAIKNKNRKHPRLIHYAGSKPLKTTDMKRYDILAFFEEIYYSKLPSGRLRRVINNNYRLIYFSVLKTVKEIVPRTLINAVKKRI